MSESSVDEAKRNETARGFTLVEAIIASLIVTITVGMLYAAIMSMQSAIVLSADSMEAQTLAFDEALVLFHMPYEDLLDQPATATRTVPPTCGLFPQGGTIRTSVLQGSNVCDIIVRVDWTHRALGGSVSAFESYSVQRYNTLRP